MGVGENHISLLVPLCFCGSLIVTPSYVQCLHFCDLLLNKATKNVEVSTSRLFFLQLATFLAAEGWTFPFPHPPGGGGVGVAFEEMRWAWVFFFL